MNVPPWLILMLVLSLALALVYQLATRRHGWRAWMYWLLIFAGMLLFEGLSESAGLSVTRFGDLRLLPDLVGAGLALSALRLVRA